MLRSATDYGDFEVSGWEKEEYEIVVTFEARARKTERAISLLDECSAVLEKGIMEGKPEATLKIDKPRTYGNENIRTKVEMHLPEKAYQIYLKIPMEISNFKESKALGWICQHHTEKFSLGAQITKMRD